MLDIPELDLSELMKEYDNYDRTGKEFLRTLRSRTRAI